MRLDKFNNQMGFQGSEDKLHLPNRNHYLPHFGCLSNLHMCNILGCVLQGDENSNSKRTFRSPQETQLGGR